MARSKKLQAAVNAYEKRRSENPNYTNTYDEDKINNYAEQFNSYLAKQKAQSNAVNDTQNALKNSSIRRSLNQMSPLTSQLGTTGGNKVQALANQMFDSARIKNAATSKLLEKKNAYDAAQTSFNDDRTKLEGDPNAFYSAKQNVSKAKTEYEDAKDEYSNLVGKINGISGKNNSQKPYGSIWSETPDVDAIEFPFKASNNTSASTSANSVKPSEDSNGTKYSKYYVPDTQLSNPTNTPKINLPMEDTALSMEEQDWLDAQKRAANAESMRQANLRAQMMAERNPALGAGISLAGNALGSVVTPIATAGAKLSGKELDPNSPAYRLIQQSNAARQGTKTGIKNGLGAEEGTFASSAVDFGVDTGLSMAETAVRMLFATPIVGATQSGLAAASQRLVEAKQNGADDTHALASAVAQGVAEEFFEKFSLEGLHSLKVNPTKGVKSLLENMAKQSFTEGSEEFFTDWANAISDYFIMGGDSEWKQNYNNYIMQGMSEEDAIMQCLTNTLEQSGLSFLGGAISGGLLGGGTSLTNYQNNTAMGRNMELTEESLREEAEAIDTNADNYTDSETFKTAQDTKQMLLEMADKVANGETLTDAEKGATVEAERMLAAEADGKYTGSEADTDKEADNNSENADEENTVNEGFDEITESDRKLFDTVKQSYHYGDKAASKYVELLSDSEKNYNPDTVKAATKALNDAARYSAINDTDFDKLWASRNALNSETVSQSLNNPYVSQLDYADRKAVFDAAVQDKMSDLKKNILTKNADFQPTGLSLESKRNTNLRLDVRAALDDYGKKIGATVSLAEALDFNADGLYNKKSGAIMLSFSADAGTGFHEVTHMVRVYSPTNYNDAADAAIEAYVRDNGKDAFDKLIDAKQENYERQTGQQMSRDDAIEEFVADSMKAFADEEYATEFAKKNTSLAEKFQNILKDVCDLLNRVYASVVDNEGSKALKNNLDMYEKAYKALSKGINEARSLREQGYTADDNIKLSLKKGAAGYDESLKNLTEALIPETLYPTVNTDIKYSMNLDDPLMAKAVKLNDKPKNDSYGHADPYLLGKVKNIRKYVVGRMKKLTMYLPADIPGQTIKNNGSYGRDIENSLICPRSLVTANFLDEVSEKLGRTLSVDEQIIASQILAELTGDQRECVYCYVKNDRAKYRAYFADYYEKYSATFDDVQKNKEAYKDSLSHSHDKNNELYSKFLGTSINTSKMWDRYVKFVESGLNGTRLIDEADLATDGKRYEAKKNKSKSWFIKDAENYCRSSTWPTSTSRKVKVDGKSMNVEYVTYNGSILNMGQDLINLLNSKYGLRMYSYSDYMPHNILENIQMVTDAAVRGLKMLGYTKDIGFAKVFAPTHMGINISTTAAWDYEKGEPILDEDGNYICEGMMGADWEEAKAVRNQYENVGIVFVAFNDDMINWALDQDWIDVVIPFHTVRTGAEVVAHFGFEDYKNEQADAKISSVWNKEWAKTHKNSIPPTEHGNDRAKYKKALAENGLTERFSRFKNNPNYMKLVNETRISYDKLEPVQPDFNLKDVLAEVNRIETEGKYGMLQGISDIEQQNYLFDQYSDKAVAEIKGQKFSLKDTDGIQTVRDLEEENNHLWQMNNYLNDSLSDVKGYTISDSQINRIVDKYIKRFESDADKKTVARNIRSMYDYIGNTAKMNSRQLASVAMSIGEDIMDAASEKDTSMRDAYPALAKDLKSYRMTLTSTARADIAKAYDSYGNFRRKTFGILNLVKNGTPSDTIYGELSDRYPELFPADIANESDQVIRIAEVAQMLRPQIKAVDYGDDYESIAYTVGQEIIGEFFNANSNPKYLENIKKIKQDMKQEFAEKEKYLERQKLDEIQSLTNKYNEASGKQKEEYKRQIKALRGDMQNNLAKLNDHYRMIEDRKAARRLDSEARRNLLKQARMLRRLKGSPEFEVEKERLIGSLDLISVGIRNDTRAKLEELRDSAKAQAELDPDYAKLEYPAMQELFERLNKKHIHDMTPEEIADLTQQIVALKYAQQAYNKTLRDDLGEKVATLGRKLVDQQNIVKGIDGGKFLSTIKTYALNMENPTRAMAMLDGYQKDGIMQLLGKGLNDGQTKAEMFKMKSKKMFDEVLDDKQLVDTFSKADIPFEAGGKTYMISKGMRISLYLHSKNRQNLKHINNGGIRIPDAKYYNKGDYENAYRFTKPVKLTPSQIDNIIGEMTPAEKKFADIAYKFFNETTKDAINDTSMVLNGYEKAVVDNYFPIKTDPNFTKKEVSGLVQDGTIEGMGMLKERTGATNPILLEDVSQVITRQIDNTARYYGLAIPVRDFNKVYNYQSTGYERSSKDAVNATWGTAGKNYIQNLLTDIQSGRKSSKVDQFFDMAKGAYASSVLNLNLGVAVKQTASYPFAAVILDMKSLAAGMTSSFTKADYDYMDSITPWSWSRRQGMSGTELGEVYKQKNIVDKNKGIQNILGKLNWIQMMDVWTTDRLFFATEAYVKDHYPSLEVRGAEYNRKVADLYNEVLQRTQPSYEVMQRNEFLRNTNAVMKALTSFKTQTFNMGGEVIDAWNRANAIKDLEKRKLASRDDVIKANKQFAKTIAVTMASQGMLAALGVLANAILHKMKNYRDKETGKVTAESLVSRAAYDYATSFAGLGFLGSESQSAILSWFGVDNWYDVSVPAFENVNEFISGIGTWRKALGNYIEDHSDDNRQKLVKATGNVAIDALAVKGIPANNVYNILNAVNLWTEDAVNNELGSFDSGTGILGLTDTSPTKNQFVARMNNAFDNRKKDDYIKAYNQVGAKFGTDKADEALKKHIKETLPEFSWQDYYSDKDATVNGILSQYDGFENNPTIKAVIESAVKAKAADMRSEDDTYKEVRALDEQYNGDELKKALKGVMKDRSLKEQKLIWSIAGFSEKTFAEAKKKYGY